MYKRRVPLWALAACLAIAASAAAQDIVAELADWVTQTEAKYVVNPLIRYSDVAATPRAYAATKAVRVSGTVTDVVPTEDARHVYASVQSDCGAVLTLWTWQHDRLVGGMRIRAVVPAPKSASDLGQPVIALAWAPESVFGVAPPTGPASGPAQGGRLLNVQPSTDPYAAGGRRNIQAVDQSSSSTYYGQDSATGLPYYGRPRELSTSSAVQQPSASSMYQPPATEQAQFAAYCNLVRYFNRRLTQDEVYRIVMALFEACSTYGVPRPLMAALIYAESSYDPLCKSWAGAMGLCQLMPGTARSLGVTSPYEIRQNIHGGVKHFARLLGVYSAYSWPSRVQLSLAAYNAGEGAVARARGIPQNRETPPYVRKVVRVYSELYSKGYR